MKKQAYRKRPMLNAQRPTLNSDVELTVFPVEACDFARSFTFNRALFQIGALIVGDFALTDAELGLQFSVLPIKLQDNKRTAFDPCFAVKFVDLLPMEQKFSNTFRRGNFVAGFFVRLNVGVIE